MSKTYKATGINLKIQAMGESDKLVSILTREFGLIRVIAPGARKHNSSLGGRSAMFVVNELLIAKGRTLDKITQAQTIKSYPGLGKDLVKLVACQYLTEIVLCQALSEQPQEELYELLNEHLSRLEVLPKKEALEIIAHLVHAIFQLLALAGLTPQVGVCCLTGQALKPDFTNPQWQVGFSIPSGGTVGLEAWENLKARTVVGVENKETLVREEGGKGKSKSPVGIEGKREKNSPNLSQQSSPTASPSPAIVKENSAVYQTVVHQQEIPVISSRLSATELSILQYLSEPEITNAPARNFDWLLVEQVLRQYVQYHFGRPIRSAALIDSYFSANHDATV
jgi:DNA repair protein RecO (recombination protein O)